MLVFGVVVSAQNAFSDLADSELLWAPSRRARQVQAVFDLGVF